MTAIRKGVITIPINTRVEINNERMPAIAFATFAASSCLFCAINFAYTGINEAERTPSPKRFCKKLGILKAALNASAASELPKKCAKTLSRISPAILLRKIPVATISVLKKLLSCCVDVAIT